MRVIIIDAASQASCSSLWVRLFNAYGIKPPTLVILYRQNVNFIFEKSQNLVTSLGSPKGSTMIYKFKSSRFLRLKKYNQQILRRLQLKASKGSNITDTNHKWAQCGEITAISFCPMSCRKPTLKRMLDRRGYFMRQVRSIIAIRHHFSNDTSH